MHRAMPGNAGQPVKRLAAHPHREVTFAALLITRMSAMLLAVINDVKLSWRESLLQPLANFFCSGHFFLPAPYTLSVDSLELVVRVEKVFL